jgi:hypothetical protein
MTYDTIEEYQELLNSLTDKQIVPAVTHDLMKLLTVIHTYTAVVQLALHEDLGLDAQNEELISINSYLIEIQSMVGKMSGIIDAYRAYHKANSKS